LADAWTDEFTAFVEAHEPRLRRALVAAVGVAAPDALADAFAYAWEHWRRVRRMDNPAGYVYRVARSRARPRKVPPALPPVDAARMPDVEPGLPAALAALPERQRVAVLLVHGFGWTHAEVGALLGVSESTVRNHLARGLDHLRRELGVTLP
jgi:DNA-directed RNA polymerase specialized sigma24 family protein